jgi:protoheme IX farnesyltransferase
MSSERIATLKAPAVAGREVAPSKVLADYWALTKPDVNLLILITTFAGFCLARPVQALGFPLLLLLHTMLGTLLVASGTGTLNQFVERRFDAQMRRTKRRPLAAGRIEPTHALWFGILLSAAGAIYLATAVNLLASLLAVVTLLSYLIVYTPLKRKTPMCTLAGAFPGAMPPLIGWAAASGTLSPEAWVLYGLVFLWQFPHFMAIAWMYREDYERAGYLVLPLGKRRNEFMAWQSFLPSFALIFLSFVPLLMENEGLIFTVAAVFLSACFFYCAGQLALRRTSCVARRLLLASILYLPLVFLLMVLDRI